MSLLAALQRGIKIALNENDHNPPHVHMKCAEGIFKIYLDSLRVEVITGNERKAAVYLQIAKEWMLEHSLELRQRWSDKEAGRKVRPIR